MDSQQFMSPRQTEYEDDALFHGYRERVRALLRHLILERGVCPSDALVTSYDHHLYLATAYSEYIRALEQGGMEALLNYAYWQRVCFRGCDLRFTLRHCYDTATSLAEQEEYVEGSYSPGVEENDFKGGQDV